MKRCLDVKLANVRKDRNRWQDPTSTIQTFGIVMKRVHILASNLGVLINLVLRIETLYLILCFLGIGRELMV